MMNRRPFYQNYGASSVPNLNDQHPSTSLPAYQHWQTTSMNNPPFNLNPQANPFQASYPPTANYFNLTSIAKNKTETHNNISKPLQKLNSEGHRPSHPLSTSESSLNGSTGHSSKKHKKEFKLEDLNKFLNETKEDISHYERKRKRLHEDRARIEEELKSCEAHLANYRVKYKNIMSDISKKQREQRESKRGSEERSSSVNSNPRSNHSTPPSKNLPNGPSNHSPVGASAASINNLTISSNAQSTINNVISNLLVKKRDVEFESYEFIFNVVEEIHEPKLVSVVGSKVDINLTFNKLLTSEEKKAGFRYIVRGCIYEPRSIYQLDNLSFVKSYEFVTSSAKKFDKKLTVSVNLNKKLVEGKKIALGVYFVKKLDFKQTIEQVHNLEKIRRKKSDITKKQVTNAFNNSAGIEMDSIKVSLIDPLTKAKIKMPCIGESCEHIGTFDALTFLESNSKKFSWFCPICGKPIGYNQLFYDELITEILKKISMDCVAIAFDKLSNWMPLSDLSERKETIKPTTNDDDDDDCIALE